MPHTRSRVTTEHHNRTSHVPGDRSLTEYSDDLGNSGTAIHDQHCHGRGDVTPFNALPPRTRPDAALVIMSGCRDAMAQSSKEGRAVEAIDADRRHSEHRKSPTCLLIVPVQPVARPAAVRSHYETAVPSSSTIRSGIASRVTPSSVVVGATPAAPNRDASTP